MRRFTPTASAQAALGCGVTQRTMLTGFSLFTHDTQKKHKVLRTKSLKEGSKKNMRVIAELWNNLDGKERANWNRKAIVARKTRIHDVKKKNSTFNLVMRVFAQGEGALLNAGNEKFTAMIAKRTTEALSDKQAHMMLKHLQVDASDANLVTANRKLAYQAKKRDSFLRMAMPDMRLFDSFTEMQHAVAPTREAAFVNVHQILKGFYVSAAGERSLKDSFRKLSHEEQDQFSPISPDESFGFEAYCASKCTLLDPYRFNILSIFAEFRGIAKMREKPNGTQVSVYRSLAAMDRARDGLYHKARRILLSMRECRSSDCSVYIAATTPPNISIPPSAYAVHGGTLSDVDVASMLAETRRNCSVYDDVLDRAAVIRPPQSRKILQVYDVRGTVLKEMPVQLVKIHGHRSERAVLKRAKQAGATTVTHVPKATVTRRATARQAASRVRTRETTAKKLDSKDRISGKESVVTRTARGRTAKASAKVRKSNKAAGKPTAAVRKRKVSAKLTTKGKWRAGAKRTAAKTVRAARDDKAVTEDKESAPPAMAVDAAVKSISTAASTRQSTQTSVSRKGTKVTAKGRAPPQAAAKEESYSMAEQDILDDEEGLADYDALDELYSTPAPVAPAVKKAKHVRAGRGGAARRVRSVANILKGSKEPILLTSHIAPSRKKGKGTAGLAQMPSKTSNSTANLLRKQLAGFL